MSKNKSQTPQNNKPLIDEEEQDKLIEEYFAEEEVEELLKEGFNKDQIAYVAKQHIKGDKQCRIIGRILNIMMWIFPFSK